MEPTLKPNQYILASYFPYLFSNPNKDEMVVFKDKENFIIKRIRKVNRKKYYVRGDNRLDSKEFGWIKREQILAKVIFIL